MDGFDPAILSDVPAPVVSLYIPVHHSERDERRDIWDRDMFKDLMKDAERTLAERLTFMARMAFRMAMTATPTSAKTAIHMLAIIHVMEDFDPAILADVTAPVMTATPTSAKTAIHMLAMPKAASTSTANLTPRANTMFHTRGTGRRRRTRHRRGARRAASPRQGGRPRLLPRPGR